MVFFVTCMVFFLTFAVLFATYTFFLFYLYGFTFCLNNSLLYLYGFFILSVCTIFFPVCTGSFLLLPVQVLFPTRMVFFLYVRTQSVYVRSTGIGHRVV